MWHIFEKERVQGYQIGYSQGINRGSYKDKDKDKDKDKVQKILYMWATCGIFSKSRGCKGIKYDILSVSPEHHTKSNTRTKTKTKTKTMC